MNQKQKLAAIEALLFTSSGALETTVVQKALDITTEEADALLNELAAAYLNEERGIMLRRLDDSWQLCTKKEYYPVLIRLASQPKKAVLTDVMLETLSIIAYKQPVTKSDIEKIRGVKSDFAVNRLIEYGLVRELGRLDAPGRPILFGTTKDFLRRFGVDSLDALPEVDPVMVEDFKAEAEAEVFKDEESTPG